MSRDYLEARRQKVLSQMEGNSLAILYSGVSLHVSEDEYHKFEVNKNFRYLTDIDRENMILVLDKTKANAPRVLLFIEEADVTMEKWYGKKLTKDEAKEISGIEQIHFLADFESVVARIMTSGIVETVYFDTFKESFTDLPGYNEVKAKEFRDTFLGVAIKNLHDFLSLNRMAKDEEEVKRIRHAVDMTRQGLEEVLKKLKPGMMEYQAQAIYEGTIKYLGSEGPSFATIAGSGYNGTMLHYETNHCECKDGDLILLDLGSKADGWCSDITRTYPINGKYSKRQKEVYDVVLNANQKVTAAAKPGVTLAELQDICKKELAEGCKKLGLIKEDSELFTYYMHGVSHGLGLDVHDCRNYKGAKLQPGYVITNEPGLYIEEENIGIRIEDDLLITEDGCEVLSKDIIRTTEEIEAFMAKYNK